MTKVTYDFSSMTDEAITGANVDQNFDDLTAAIDQITTANIATTAGITSTQLADRYTLSALGPIAILPPTAAAGTLGATPTEFTMPASDTTVYQTKALVKPGRRAFLVKAEVYTQSRSGTDHPRITIIVGGTTLAGSAQNITSTGYLSINNTNPVDSPLLPLNNDDVIEIKLGQSGGSGGPSLAGVSVTLWIKEELVP